MGRAVLFVFVALGTLICLVHPVCAADAAPREARPLSAKDLRIDPEVDWQRAHLVTFPEGRPLEGQPKSVLNVWLNVRGEAAARASACGDFLVDSVKDENENPVPRDRWICTRGLLLTRVNARDPKDGVQLLFQLRDPPPLKKLSEVRGSFVLRIGGVLQEVVLKDFLKPGGRVIDNATLKGLGVAVVTTRTTRKPVPEFAKVLPNHIAPGVMPDAQDELEFDITSGDSPVTQIAITDPSGESSPPLALNYDTTIKKATFGFKEKLPEGSQLRLTVHRDAQEMQVPFVLRDVEVPPENGPDRNRPLISSASPPAGPLDVAVEEIRATRSNNEFQTGLEVTLKLSGTEFEKAAECRCRLTKAVDDTGADLIRAEEGPPGPHMFGHTFRLKLPARKAQVLKELSGVVEMLLPERDPQATIKVTGFAARPSVKVSHPTLTASGATVTIVSKAEFDRLRGMPRDGSPNLSFGGPPHLDLTPKIGPEGPKDAATKGNAAPQAVEGLLGALASAMGGGFGLNENSVVAIQNDPNRRIWKIEFYSPSGDPIPIRCTEGGNDFSDNGVLRNYTGFSFDKKLPETAVMRIMVATPTAVTRVPFSLKNVSLP
jgi:hypothetical protein